MYSSYLTFCDIQLFYYRVSNKRSPRLLIFDFFSTHDSCPTFSWQLPRFVSCPTYYSSKLKLLMTWSISAIFLCQICKKCRSFNLTLLTNKLNFKSLQLKNLRELHTFRMNSPTVCIYLRLFFNKLNENFRLSHCDVYSKIHSFVGEF